MRLKSYFKRKPPSLKGHIQFYGAPFFFFFHALGFGLNLSEGPLTASLAIQIVVVSAIMAPAPGILVWYLVTRPYAEKKSEEDDEMPW